MSKSRIRVFVIAAAVIGAGAYSLRQQDVHAQSGYTLDSVKGTYGFVEQGGIGGAKPVAGVGLLIADGAGGISGSESVDISGAGMTNRTFRGTYFMNSNGSGEMLLTYDPLPDQPSPGDDNYNGPQTAKFSFVVVNNRIQLKGIRADSGFLVTADFTRQ